MKRLFQKLPLVFSLFLCHCGTEVGNGVAPETKATGSATPTASEGATNDSASPGQVTIPLFSSSFLAACASPFAEVTNGTYANGTSGFTVTVAVDGRKLVTLENSGAVIYTITPTPAVSSYAIEALNISPSVTCSGVTTQAVNETTFTRTVTLSNGDAVQWTLSSGVVTSLSVTSAALTTETWIRK